MPTTDLLRRPVASGLGPFLALSALLHAALIGLFPSDGRAAPHPSPRLHLFLAHPQTAPAGAPHGATQGPTGQGEKPRKPAPPIPPTAGRSAATMAAQEVRSQTGNERASTPASAPASLQQETAHRAEETSARVIAHLHATLAHYFTYPLLARRRGWQGEVVLGFAVTPEGRIDGVKVVRSSGYRLLDDAARTALARVGNLPRHMAPGSLPLQLQMPIIYRLAEG